MENKLEIRIALPTIVAVVVVMIFLASGVGIVRALVVDDTAAITIGTPAESSVAVASSTLITASASGVDVTVEAIERADGKTRLTLGLNNHMYDLTDPSIAARSSLDGVTPSAYEVLSSAMGGHHVTAEMVFDGELDGPFVYGVTEEAIVILEI